MVKGNQAKVYIGKETTYGVQAASPQFKFRFASEDLKVDYEKKEEGLLTGGKAASRTYTMGIKGSGKISTLLRPDEVGYFLYGAFGDYTNLGDVSGKTNHEFKLVDGVSYLPSFTIWVDRGIKKFAYLGCTITNLEFSGAAGDFVKLDISVNCVDEVEVVSITDTLNYTNTKPYRFYHGVVKVEGAAVADITSVKYAQNNNAELSIQTTDTGVKYKRPVPGVRDIQLDFEALYDTASIGIKDLYKQDDVVSLELVYTNEDNDKLDVVINSAQITGYSGGTATSADVMKVNYTAKVVDDTGEPIVVDLFNDVYTNYWA